MKIENKKMKYSGIEWIGKIPSEWALGKVKYGFVRKNRKAFEENPIILSLARDGVKVRDITTNEGQIAESYYEYNPVTIDDLLLNPMDIQSGANCSISKVNGVISPAYMNLRYKEGFNPHYYDYFFKLCYWNYIFFSYGKGVSYDNRWTLNDNTIMNFIIIQPSITEQTKIANFLDFKCSKIDKVIKDINQQIETLENYKKTLINDLVTGKKVIVGAKLCEPEKTKDSGVEWIGKVPEEWKVIKLKYVSKVRNEKNEQDYSLDYFALENIESWNSKYVETKNTYSPIGSNLCYKGDLVFGKLRPYLAKTFMVDYDRCCSSEFAIFYDFKEYNKFILYAISSYGFITVVDSSTYGTKMPRANIEFIIDMYIPIPPLSEQYKITDYLDTKCSKIDNIINQKINQIDTLEKYKKSLIFEYVTGKKQVMLGGTNE